MGILNPSQRTVPSSSEILPFPNAWNRYTVKKLMNISGVASTRARRNDDASRTVSASSKNSLSLRIIALILVISVANR